MDFPLYFIDFMGNRIIMAFVAIIHVIINHPMAVGGYPLLVLLEWWGMKTGNKEFDDLAYKVTFVIFIITTTIGAMTGVGIWVTSSLIAPFGIGSLLRVFFWAWFTEWFVFIIEVCLIMAYFLTWKKWSSGADKKKHLGLGIALAAFSWITMAIITAILGFMMDPTPWQGDIVQPGSMLQGFLNPLYLPQLALRTPYAMLTGGLMVWMLIALFTKRDSDIREATVRIISKWIICWVPFVIIGGIWYWSAVPEFMKSHANIALMTKGYAQWHQSFLKILLYCVDTILFVTFWGLWRPRKVPGILLMIPFIMSMWFLGHFERVREFVRKPYIIADYMYANGIRKSALPIYQRDGMLTYSTYSKHNAVTSSNKVEAGEDVFMIACSRCHTGVGMNGVVNKFEDMYGEEWNDMAMASFIKNMNTSHPYMPPFPGNDKEIEALIEFLRKLKVERNAVHGAQWKGIPNNEYHEYEAQK